MVFAQGESQILKVPIDGGEPVKLIGNAFLIGPVISPDGKLIACWRASTDVSLALMTLVIFPFEGGQFVKTLEIPPTTNTSVAPCWASDDGSLLYIDTRHGVSNIWSQPLDGGPPKQLTNFMSDLIFSFGWSRDGKQLACARGSVTNDVILISNFR